MISLTYIILIAAVAGFLALMAAFLRLMVEDWEAVEIDEDELESPDSSIPAQECTLTGGKKSFQL
jgi:hypothetical protein